MICASKVLTTRHEGVVAGALIAQPEHFCRVDRWAWASGLGAAIALVRRVEIMPREGGLIGGPECV